jgi:hypothetical protein
LIILSSKIVITPQSIRNQTDGIRKKCNVSASQLCTYLPAKLQENSNKSIKVFGDFGEGSQTQIFTRHQIKATKTCMASSIWKKTQKKNNLKYENRQKNIKNLKGG